jgi:uncharacterized protein YbaR (Trm112 family)
MAPDLMEILVCPLCKGPLELSATETAESGDIVSGTLSCGACNERYPIVDGIPNLLPPDMRDA